MIGDARYLPLKDNSVNCIITSPPYWSLRKYDIPDLVWDGKEECEHEWGTQLIKKTSDNFNQNFNERWGNASGERKQEKSSYGQVIQGQFCLHCSAWRGQLGLEPTIELYLKHLMQIMDECKRVLRDDGTMWVNLGDSYSGSGKGIGTDRTKCKEVYTDDDICKTDWSNTGIPTKSLCLIPERFAIEMVNKGWILRNKIIWAKPNCMPASVKDRFTVDFEPVFFFVKNKKYWFEAQYDHTGREATWEEYNNAKEHTWPSGGLEKGAGAFKSKNAPSLTHPQGRNRRCVWTIPTQPYPESHFATFPEALIEPMIRAGCPKEICVKCGKAREKIVEEGELIYTGNNWSTTYNPKKKDPTEMSMATCLNKGGWKPGHQREKKILGLTDCGCNAGFRPGTVLDPFCGSGTTLRVAEKLNRVGMGIDLAYEGLQNKRMTLIQKELL